jgi:hypothetical protein
VCIGTAGGSIPRPPLPHGITHARSTWRHSWPIKEITPRAECRRTPARPSPERRWHGQSVLFSPRLLLSAVSIAGNLAG